MLLSVSCDSLVEDEKVRLLEKQIIAEKALEQFNSDKTYNKAIIAYQAINEVWDNLVVDDLKNEKQKEAYLTLRHETNIRRKRMRSELEKSIPEVEQPIYSQGDQLLDKGRSTMAAKLQKGDVIKYSYNTTNPICFKIYNIDSKTCIKEYIMQTNISDSLVVSNTAIYLFEFENKQGMQYISYHIARYCKTLHNLLSSIKVSTEEQPAGKGDFMAYSKNEYKVTNLFQEPRKVTLRGSWKAAWSGHKRTIIALNIPPNTIDVAYQLRIDTSDGANAQDGQFFNTVKQDCSKVQIMGVTLKEKTESHTSILRELLSKMETPKRAEEAYCSMYVFYKGNDAKVFAANNARSVENYDVDHSIIGTQSCNGSIPVSGKKNVYLCFENDQFSGSVYLWLEAVATSTETNFYKLIYK